MQVTWAELKAFVDARNVSIQWVELFGRYNLLAFDGPFYLETNILKLDPASDDQLDFETNYKSSGNKSPKSEVVTQFEKNDKTIQLFSAEAAVQEDGIATIEIKIPGESGRWIAGANCFFDVTHAGDRVISAEIVDKDNIMGYGSDTILGSYMDLDANEENQGWRIPPKRGYLEVETLAYYGFIPSGLYLVITAKKSQSQTSGTFYINMDWGKDG